MQSTVDEELYAMRTIGSFDRAGRKLCDYDTPVTDEVIYSLSAALRPVIGNKKAEDFVNLAVRPTGVPSNGHGGVWTRLIPRDNLAVLLNYLYHNMFFSYVSVSVIEMRNQQNEAIATNDEAEDFTHQFDDGWLQANINYIAGIPSMSAQEATKAAHDICMQKKQKASINTGRMGARPSSE